MLKEPETEETIGFFVPFLSFMSYQLGGAGPQDILATPMNVQRGVSKRCLKDQILSKNYKYRLAKPCQKKSSKINLFFHPREQELDDQ